MPLFLVTPVASGVGVLAIAGEVVQNALRFVEHLVLSYLLFVAFAIFSVDGKSAQDPDCNGNGSKNDLSCHWRPAVEKHVERNQHEEQGCEPGQENHSGHFSFTPEAISFAGRPEDEDGHDQPSAHRRIDNSTQA